MNILETSIAGMNDLAFLLNIKVSNIDKPLFRSICYVVYLISIYLVSTFIYSLSNNTYLKCITMALLAKISD